MIKDIIEINFPDYATLDQATVTINDMGDRTISAQVKIDGSIVPDFSFDWAVEFKGEKYIHPVREPQGSKDNTSRRSKIDMVFYHWAIYEMKRQYFMEMASTSTGTAVADKYVAPLGLNLGDFVTAFNLVLNHYFGGKIIMKLNPEWQYDTETSFVNISYSYIWDVLQQMHEIYGVRWSLKTNSEGVCEILMGYPAKEMSHVFEYGFDGGLLSVQRQVQSTEIRNRLLGRGGEKNLPYRYFKDVDPKNPVFAADPDWIPELANIAFTELRGKTFRDYVKGWKAKKYGGTAMTQPTEAYLAGYNADKFDPIEFVEDKDSVEKYGVLVGALENNEEIYPSIQGAPGNVDAIVEAEQVTDDDVESTVENDSVVTNINHTTTSQKAEDYEVVEFKSKPQRRFTVPEGKIGNLDFIVSVSGVNSSQYNYEKTAPIKLGHTVKIYDADTNMEVFSLDDVSSVANIPAGSYYFDVTVTVDSNYHAQSSVTLSVHTIKLYCSTPGKASGWSQTFDIWVRDIWGSSRETGETDQQFADRVWGPILGDRTGGEARVVFSTGRLSFSSDWEFPIVGYAYDDSVSGAMWKLTLAKSEAELEASGKYIPYEGYNASAGDRFFFIGIDMPHQYVEWAEERLDDYKRDSLLQTANIKPTWVIKTDKIKLNESVDGVKLIDSLTAGAQIRLASKQFISGAYENLYVQSMTYSWQAGTLLYPDVEIVVSDKVAAVKNPVTQIQSSIESIQRQVGSLSNIQQAIRRTCDQLYLRKDGVEDVSKSPTRFLGKVSGEKFRQGQIGGRDWGIYRDENGNAIIEADKVVIRQEILVNNLVVNEATYVGGMQINSAAAMKVTAVEDTEAGYVCYFDQKQGTVVNKFVVDDVVLCQRFSAEDTEIKFYKSRVIAVDEASVTLSKTEVNGSGIPSANDEIIQYGNYTDKNRQFVIIRDVIGGGYERMLMNLDSVTSTGTEYYFAGKSADSLPRWFVGDANSFAKYENGQFTVKGNLLVTGSDKSISEQLGELDYIRKALGEGLEGLILGSAIVVGYNDENGSFVPMAGISGVYDKEAADGGPAAWYGGTLDNATSKLNMDGTGYFASGLFAWDLATGLDLGNGSIKINYDGSVEFGGDIKIGGTGEATLDSLLVLTTKLSQLWGLGEDGVLVTDKKVRIKNDLIVEGEVATKAEGGSSSGGGFNKEELQDYLDENKYVTEPDVEEMISGLKADVSYLETILGIDAEAEGYINTWEEVKAFLDGYSHSDDLATILSGMNADIKDVTDWSDALKPFLYVEDGNIKVTTNLIVSGDVSTDEDGQSTPASGTVTGIVVDGQSYGPTAGIIDLTAAFDAIDVSGQLADYAKTDYVNEVLEGYVTNTAFSEGLANKAEKTRKITAGDGLTGSGTLEADITLALAESGVTAGTYPKITVDKYGRVTGGASLVAADVPELAIAKITGLQTALDNRYTKDDLATYKTWWDALMPKVTVNANDAVAVSSDLVVSGDVSTGGDGTGTGAAGTVTAIAVNGRTYEPTAGIVTIPDYPTSLEWNAINGRPTHLSDFTDDVVSGKYLPLSGGVINGTLMNPLTIKTSAAEVGIPMSVNNSAKMWVGWNSSYGAYLYNSASSKYLGIKNDGTPHYNGSTLIHSGNIGEQKVAETRRFETIVFSNSSNRDLNTALFGGGLMRNYSGYASSSFTNHPNDMRYGCVLELSAYGTEQANNDLAGQLAWDVNHRGADSTRFLWWRANDDTAFANAKWHQIAFTDSDITGNAATASALKTASYKYAFVNGNNVLFGYETAQNNYDTILAGKSVSLRYGPTPTVGLVLNSSGNVTIGTSDLASTNYKLYVDGSALANGSISAAYGDAREINLGASNSLNAITMGVAASGVAYVFGRGNYDLGFSTNSTRRMTISASGNVGIGTDSPSCKLDVAGSIKSTTLTTLGIELTGGTPFIDFHYNNSTADFTTRIYEIASGKLRMTSALQVAGATELQSTLSVSGKTTISNDLVVSGDVSTGGSGTSSGGGTTESNCLGPVELDMQSITSLGTFTQAQMDGLGLTTTVISNMLAGLYTKVIGLGGGDVYDYNGFGTIGSIIRLFLRQGNGESVDYTYTLYYDGSKWTITEN